MGPSYSKEARLRIVSLGAPAIIEFLENIPPKSLSNILPIVDGFKRNSPRENKERIKKLVNALCMSNLQSASAEREWTAFRNCWLMWGVKQHKDLFKGTSENALFDKKGELEFLDNFIKTCGTKECSSEAASNLIKFSGYPLSSEAKILIDRLPSESTLEQKRLIIQLQLEMKDIRTKLDESRNSAPAIDYDKKILNLEEIQGEFNQKIDLCLNRIDKIDESSCSYFSNIDEKLKIIDEISSEFSTNAKKMEALRDELSELDKRTSHSEDLISELQISEDEESRDGLEKIPATSMSSLFEIQISSSSADVSPKLLETITDTVELLSDNFSKVGLQRKDARNVAEIVASAIYSGQMMQFCGSLADVLADVTTSTLISDNLLVWHIPLGLCDSNLSEQFLSQVRHEPSGIHGAILKGVNRSAFEIYGDHIRKLIIDRLLERSDSINNLPIIATWATGPSTLMDCTSLLELGPLIDSDKLNWSKPKWKKITYGKLSFENIIRSQTIVNQEAFDTVDSIIALDMPLTQLQKWMTVRAISTLFQIGNVQAHELLESVTIGWILPWAIANNVDIEKFRTSLDKQMPQVFNNEIVARLLSASLKF